MPKHAHSEYKMCIAVEAIGHIGLCCHLMTAFLRGSGKLLSFDACTGEEIDGKVMRDQQ